MDFEEGEDFTVAYEYYSAPLGGHDVNKDGATDRADVQAILDCLTGKVDVLGKDGAPTGKHNIKEGKEVQSAAQRPTYMGYQAVVTALKILNGEEVEFKTLIPSYSITADNIDEFDLDAWDAIEEE